MLDFVRTHQRWLQFILLLLILPAFVLTGVASFSRSSSADVVAKHAGHGLNDVFLIPF